MPELMLYYFPSCPYCCLVLDCLDRLDLEISMRDIQSEPGARDELLEIGGIYAELHKKQQLEESLELVE